MADGRRVSGPFEFDYGSMKERAAMRPVRRALARRLCAVVLPVLTAACGDRITCAGVGLARLSPVDTTIGVGATFAVHYQEGGTCSDESHAKYYDVPIVWHTADTAIVRLDSLSGRVTGRAIGDAHLSAVDRALVVSVHVR